MANRRSAGEAAANGCPSRSTTGGDYLDQRSAAATLYSAEALLRHLSCITTARGATRREHHNTPGAAKGRRQPFHRAGVALCDRTNGTDREAEQSRRGSGVGRARSVSSGG